MNILAEYTNKKGGWFSCRVKDVEHAYRIVKNPNYTKAKIFPDNKPGCLIGERFGSDDARFVSKNGSKYNWYIAGDLNDLNNQIGN